MIAAAVSEEGHTSLRTEDRMGAAQLQHEVAACRRVARTATATPVRHSYNRPLPAKSLLLTELFLLSLSFSPELCVGPPREKPEYRTFSARRACCRARVAPSSPDTDADRTRENAGARPGRRPAHTWASRAPARAGCPKRLLARSRCAASASSCR